MVQCHSTSLFFKYESSSLTIVKKSLIAFKKDKLELTYIPLLLKNNKKSCKNMEKSILEYNFAFEKRKIKIVSLLL